MGMIRGLLRKKEKQIARRGKTLKNRIELTSTRRRINPAPGERSSIQTIPSAEDLTLSGQEDSVQSGQLEVQLKFLNSSYTSLTLPTTKSISSFVVPLPKLNRTLAPAS